MLITIIECSSLRVICIKTHTHLLTPLPTFFSLSNRAAKSGDQIKALGESLLYQVSLRRSEPREAQCQQGAYRNTLRLHSVVKKAPFSCQEKKVQVQENQFLNNFSCSLSNRVVRLVFYVSLKTCLAKNIRSCTNLNNTLSFSWQMNTRENKYLLFPLPQFTTFFLRTTLSHKIAGNWKEPWELGLPSKVW